jgi:hypothetical protein
MHRFVSILLAAGIVCLLLRVGASARKTSVCVFEHQEGIPRNLNAGLEKSDMVFHPMKCGSYGESWFFLAMLEDGGWITSLLATTNQGMGKFRSSVDFAYYEADGTMRSVHKNYKRNHLTASEDSFSVKIGKNYAGGEYPNYRLVINENELQAELTYTCLTRGWKPGDGFLYFGEEKDQFWKFVAPSPRAKVTGHIVIDEKKIDLNGLGHHDHTYSNIKKPSYTKVQYVFRMFTEEFTLSLMKIILQDGYDRNSVDMLMVAQDDRIIFTTTELSYVPSRFKRDKDTGYRIPYEFKLKASVKGPSSPSGQGFSIEGNIEIENMLEKYDVLAQIGKFQKAVVKTFVAKPFLYRFSCRYDLELKMDEIIRHLVGKGFSEANFMD